MNSKANKPTRHASLQKILAGVEKHFSNVPTLTLGRVTYPLADLEKLIQQDLDGMDATAKAKASYLALVQVERDTHAKVSPVLRLLRSYVIALMGDTQAAKDVLDDFGYSPRKPSKKTVATMVEAADKAKATRAARHTMGKKQKAKITGETPGSHPPPAPSPAPHANGTSP